MRPPVDVRSLVALAREARSAPAEARPVHVSGPRAPEVVEALSRGARSGLVRVGTGEGASVLVLVLDGPVTGADEAVLRAATRARVPAVVLRTATGDEPVPYVGATEVVQAPAGEPLPVAALARAIARVAGDDGVPLAAGVPTLAGPVQATTIARAAAAAAVVAGTPLGGRVHLPVLAAAQTRMLGALRRTRGTELAGDEPQVVAQVVGPEIALPLLAGTAARAVVRRLPAGGAPLRAGVAAGVTIGLGVLATRLAGRLPGA